MSDFVERNILKTVGVMAVRQITRRIREKRISPSTNKKGTTLVGRGNLLRSLKYRTEGDAVVISAGDATVPYARIHHEGGVIKPKNAKYLAIPLTPGARASAPRYYPGETFSAKGVIFEKLENGKVKALYALKKQVEIPARPYMLLDNNDKTLIKNAIMSKLEIWKKQAVKHAT